MVSLTAFLLLLGQTPDSSAYLDRDARVLVARARAARDSQATTIRAYTALVKQRVGAALRTPLKDRMLYRKEMAARVHWSRADETVVQILGGREFHPGSEYSRKPPRFSLDELFDPTLDRLYFGMTDSEDDDVWIDHPLVAGAEEKYRFRTGDTVTMRFPDGQQLRIVELHVLPRSSTTRLISGSIWIDPSSGVIVKAAYHLPATFNLERDTDVFEDDDDLENVPGIFKPFEIDITMISVEYSYWRLKHWLPRSMRMEGMARAGILKTPGAMEVSYDFQEVVEEGDSSTTALDIRNEWRLSGYDVHRGRTNGRRVSTWSPRDPQHLASSPDLPPPIWESSNDFITEKELRKMYGGLAALPQASSPGTEVQLLWGPKRLDLLRFNRVEGPSVGVTMEARRTFGTYWTTARLGLADWHPNVEIGARRETLRRTLTATVSHGLVAVDSRSLGPGASLSALLLGRDDGDYYRTTGARISVSPPVTHAQWYRFSLFAERQHDAERETQMSLPRVFDGGFGFRPNLQADAADLAGSELLLRGWWGTDPRGYQTGVELNVDGAAGDFRYGRASLTARTAFPIVANVRGALEAGAGSSEGRLPAQQQFFLGGAHTLRGYGGAAAVGPSFVRGRAELAYTTATLGISLFGDGGWAGRRNDFLIDDSLLSAGVGATILDGLIRIDLARALRKSPGWRLELHLDATL
jgi:hypothetical protein